jgi:carbonic anhydrase/acetyltransferase-like protein (isoleucine patch superfamily)
MIFGYQGLMPKVHERAFVSDTAVLIGDVEIGEESSVWFGAVLHGCTIGDGVPVGIGAKVLDGAIIG